uniref:Small ribosomal subunit protein uS19c n=7 Tax=Sargassum TaxID=3015 RepID=A0A6B9TP15_SARFS|nr:ribosomal protein S19 [Sargassum thunbergii]YP_009243815.1 ribsomal protein S19 [Sargassum horneri]YP_009828362.1 ribosomal protein S19 [Sargassum fusiforme]YP_010411912.1 ribosomal protein S19 [Sargassum siliquastrum]YP_010471320.1 30S ribosomal protein S19 [Sargassum confusum]YP_010485429.1 30S ribosomal protein S19 [Sargassum macrocarpum]YP_010485568.1 30S ribosomal protein S19 [Sargassum serratifolium]QNO36108.1 ribsomal protein S19 [Sargassum hemiphyllum var. chinense]QXI87602.1 rib
MARSFRKGPFIAYHLLQKIEKMNKTEKKNMIKTWSRSSIIIPSMIGHTIAVYNGKQHIPLFISEQIIGHKLGEFVPTRNFRSHLKNSDRRLKRK